MNLHRQRVERKPGLRLDEGPFEASASAKDAVTDAGPVRLFPLATGEDDDLVRLADDHVGLDEADQAEQRQPAQPDRDTDDLRLVHFAFLFRLSVVQKMRSIW